jgi:hypothetical protein
MRARVGIPVKTVLLPNFAPCLHQQVHGLSSESCHVDVEVPRTNADDFPGRADRGNGVYSWATVKQASLGDLSFHLRHCIFHQIDYKHLLQLQHVQSHRQSVFHFFQNPEACAPVLIAIFNHSSVTGANRGLGLEFVKQYSQDSNVTVLAYQRSDDRSAIEALKKDNVKIIKLDAADDEQVKVSVGWVEGSKNPASEGS